MFYLRSKSGSVRKALVPFTQPVDIGGIEYERDRCYGYLTCNGHRVFEHSFRDAEHREISARNKMCSILETIITYMAEYIENAIEDGEIEGIIDLEDWKEDVT